MKKETIIIVGAGIAGLTAARKLANHNNVILLEADNRAGGRIFGWADENFTQTVEGGSEFIHGKLKHTLQLLKKAGIKYVPVKGEMYRKEKGEWKQQHDIIEGWDKLLRKMKKIKEDMTMGDFLNEYYSDEKFSNLRRNVIAFTEGFDVANIKKVSVRSLYKEWSHEEGINFRIPGGYHSLIEFLVAECKKKRCRIFTNETVKQIDWEPGSVAVYTNNDNKYQGGKVIVTVPVSILQRSLSKASINFTPPLDDYIAASKQIGFGSVIRIVLEFKEAIWKENTGFILTDEIIPTWWTQLPDPVPLLTGWVGGTKADLLSAETDDELLQKALLSLSNIFEMPVENIKEKLSAAKIFNWQNNDFALGGYSYLMPNSSVAIELLNTPAVNTIFFCGEALYEGNSPGTVEAAIANAKQTAAKILKG